MTRSLTYRIAYVPALLYVLSAAIGLWIAYDRLAAVKQFALVAVGIMLYAAVAYLPKDVRRQQIGNDALRIIFRVLPIVVAVYFLLTNDWANRIGKLAWFDGILGKLAGLQTGLVEYGSNTNVIGGVMAALIPIQIAVLEWRNARSKCLSGILVAVSALVLLLSESRGAWLALTMGMAAWCLWGAAHRLGARMGWNPRHVRRVLVAMLGMGAAAIVFILAVTPIGDRLLSLRTDRLTVWRNSLDLVGDYAFTGLGLGSFEMAYSSYALLVHVGHTTHAHNLYLDIWAAQGALGLAAFIGLVLVAVWPKGKSSWWAAPALVSACVILLHGLVDDAFYGYGGNAIPLLFLSFGLAGRPVTSVVACPSARRRETSLTAGGLAGLLLLSFVPGVQSAVHANLGAVAQTRAELSVYSWPTWPVQDAARRSDQVDLVSAMRYYQQALAYDASNASANRRLGQILLSQGQYDEACRRLSAAYSSAPGQRATRQLLGECFAIEGDAGSAAALWRSIDVSQGQLETRHWWYAEYLHDQGRATHMVEAISDLSRN